MSASMKSPLFDRSPDTEAAIEAGNASALNSVFTAISHEINTPLAVIQGHGELLLDAARNGTIDALRVESTALKIVAMSKRISRIIGGLKAIAKGQRLENCRDWSANTLVADATELCTKKLREAAVEIAIRGDDGINISCRGWQITQVLCNLINNACDAIATAEIKWIRVGFDRTAAGVTFTVTDSGSGIAPEMQGKLFQPFFSNKVDGTGVGLVVSRQIIDSHGGQLFIDPYCQNTRFIFTLPTTGENLLAPKPAAAKVHTPDTTVSPAPMLDLKVLLIDDEVDYLQIAKTHLAQLVHKVTTASSFTEARNLLQKDSYDAVVTDVKIPGEESGIAFCRTLRLEGFKKPIIVVSGSVFDLIDSAIEAGADAIFRKPVNFGAIVSRLGVLTQHYSDADRNSRRRSERIDAALPVKAIHRTSDTATVVTTEASDISAGGACLAWSDLSRIEIGDELSLRIFINTSETVGVATGIQAVVRWKRPGEGGSGGLVGVEFTEMNNFARTLIREYINETANRPKCSE